MIQAELDLPRTPSGIAAIFIDSTTANAADRLVARTCRSCDSELDEGALSNTLMRPAVARHPRASTGARRKLCRHTLMPPQDFTASGTTVSIKQFAKPTALMAITSMLCVFHVVVIAAYPVVQSMPALRCGADWR